MDRRQLLEIWQEERRKKKIIEAASKTKPFLTGIAPTKTRNSQTQHQPRVVPVRTFLPRETMCNFDEAARKAKKQHGEQSIPACAAAGEERIFNEGFFSICSPVRVMCTPPRKPNLSKAVLSSKDSASKIYSPFAPVSASMHKLDEIYTQTQEPAGEMSAAISEVPAGGKKNAVKPAVKKTARPDAQSRIKDIIAAARKAKKQHGEQSIPACAAAGEERIFNEGFFSLCSPVRVMCTPPRKPNLSKAVLSSKDSASKISSPRYALVTASFFGKDVVVYEGIALLSISSPFAHLRASILGQNLEEYEGFALLPQTPDRTSPNLSATPVRSTLKTPQSAKPANKSVIL